MPSFSLPRRLLVAAILLAAGAASASAGECPAYAAKQQCNGDSFMCRIHVLYPPGLPVLVIDRDGYIYDSAGHRLQKCARPGVRSDRRQKHHHHHH